MKKLLLITLVPMTLSLQGAFVMKKGQPLTRIEQTIETIETTKPTINESTPSEEVGFTKTPIPLGKTSLKKEDKHLVTRYSITAPFFKPTGWDDMNVESNPKVGVNWVKQYELSSAIQKCTTT